MPSITVGSLTSFSSLNYTGTDALAFAQQIANTINAGLNGGPLSQFVYPTGATTFGGTPVAGQPGSGANGVAAYRGVGGSSLFIDGADQFITVGADPVTGALAPVSIQGGAAGGSLVAGAGAAGAARNLTYTNITPSGTLTDSIAVLGGNNLIQSAQFGTGKMFVVAGSGNDTINLFNDNGSTVNPGSGSNQVNVFTGGNLIYSEGFDTITGAGYGSNGGTDTVQIGSGQTSINSGGTSFFITDSSPNALSVRLGSGVDTVNYGGSGNATVNGIFSTTALSGAGTVIAGDTSTGDSVTLLGSLNSTVTAGAANETITGAGNGGRNLFTAGSGNDTLIAGAGTDTLAGGSGSAFMVSGGGATTFSFTNGQSGGSDTISGFKAADSLSFAGYGANPLALGGTTGSVPGGTTYNLTDGTTITVLGVSQPAGSQIKTS